MDMKVMMSGALLVFASAVHAGGTYTGMIKIVYYPNYLYLDVSATRPSGE